MNYIADTLGVNVSTEPWNRAALLPFYLTDAYSFQAVTLDEVRGQMSVREAEGRTSRSPHCKETSIKNSREC
jgi:hypothetical protein